MLTYTITIQNTKTKHYLTRVLNTNPNWIPGKLISNNERVVAIVESYHEDKQPNIPIQ